MVQKHTLQFHLLGAHICISDLRHRCEREDNDQQAYETSKTEIRPLDVLESLICVYGLAKKTREARRGATKDPTAWTAWARLRRISEYLGGPQIERKGSVAVSSVESPAPTTNMLPQKPPKECFTPEGYIRRHPVARTQRPVMKVTRKPYLRRVQPEDSGRAEEVGAEVSCAETGRFGGRDVEGALEMRI
jgi:hypothetical protein